MLLAETSWEIKKGMDEVIERKHVDCLSTYIVSISNSSPLKAREMMNEEDIHLYNMSMLNNYFDLSRALTMFEEKSVEFKMK